MANRVGVEEGWESIGHSCIAAPSGGFLARLGKGVGVAIGTVSPDNQAWQTWRTVATYLQDRRTDLYEKIARSG